MNNREIILQIKKERERKRRVQKGLNETVQCECGRHVRRDGLDRQKKSNIHKKKLKKINEEK
jgi:hypothetical protein